MKNITDDIENITTGQIIKTIIKLKISTLIAIITVLASMFSGIFMFGRHSIQKNVVIELNQPFDIRIDNSVQLKDVVLVKNNSLIESDEYLKAYSIKQITDEFDDKPIGQVVVKQEKTNNK